MPELAPPQEAAPEAAAAPRVTITSSEAASSISFELDADRSLTTLVAEACELLGIANDRPTDEYVLLSVRGPRPPCAPSRASSQFLTVCPARFPRAARRRRTATPT